jgi:glycosyltransferase involved in cell wall biosynthesis
MKIALLTTWFPPLIVGSGNRFYEIGKRLAGKHEVHVYTTGIEGSEKEEEMDGMYVHRYGIFDTSKSIEKGSSLHNLKFNMHLLRKIPTKSFCGTTTGLDIIDCNIVSKMLPYVSYFISKSTHAPLIETWHEVWYKQNFTQYNPVKGLPGFYLELFMPKLADMNIAVSETTKRRLVNLLGVNPDKIVVIPNGVDLNKFDAISMDKKYGRILYVGRLESHKRVDTLMLAYHRLKKRYADIELIIVGKGPQKGYLQNFSKELNLKDVTFYDSLSYDKLIELMKSSWVFVLPSVREGQGIVVLEAMAAGTPLIAIQAEGSAVGDIVKNDYNGLLVPGGEIERAIQKLLTNEDLYTKIRKNGLQFVKGYDWAKTAERTAEVYEKIR